MKKFFLKLFFVLFPVLFVLVVYFYNDPFKVLYHYDSYYPENGIQYIELNKDVVSTETLINNYSKYKYDSYIFGSSRSIRYQISEWEKYINSKKCFHFDAYSESLLGIEKKLEFLNNKGIHIENALFILDEDILVKTKNEKSHFLLMDPKLSGQNELEFQFTSLKTFLEPDFLLAYIRFIRT